MQPTYVSSSNIDTINYSLNTIYIRFKNGSSYKYNKVPYHVYSKLVSAESVGQEFHRSIRGKFEYEKLVQDPFSGERQNV